MFSRRTEFEPVDDSLRARVDALRTSSASPLDLRPGSSDARARAPRAPVRHAATDATGARQRAREAVARDWARRGVDVSASHVALCASERDAYAKLLLLFCDPHDEVLVPSAGMPWLDELAQLADVHLVTYGMRRRSGALELDPADVFDAITERTRFVVVASPQAPTGRGLDAAALDALASLGLPLVVDESAPALLLDDDSPVTSVLTAPREELCIAVGGLGGSALDASPSLAWLAVTGPHASVHEALERLARVDAATDAVSAEVAEVAAERLEAAPDARREAQARARRNLDALQRAVSGTPVRVVSPEVGGTVAVRLPATRTDDAWALALLEAGVLVQPASRFGMDEHDAMLVLSLLAPAEAFDAGVRALVGLVAG